MSALAAICLSRNHNVSGSDISHFENEAALVSAGANVRIGHTKTDFSDIDLVVYTAALSPDNPELLAAKAQNIPCIKRSQLLGRIAAEHENVIAVSGMHGKTTTTSMIAHALEDFEPTVHLGGHYAAIGGNYKIGSTKYFITEACEYKRSFCYVKSSVSVILNIDEEHMDYFRDINDIIDAFTEFASQTDPSGVVVVNGDDLVTQTVAKQSGRRYITFGLSENCNYRAINITHRGNARFSCDVYKNNVFAAHLDLSIVGKHNIYNALAAMAAIDALGVSLLEDIAKKLNNFSGADRRFQLLGVCKGAMVYSDYAHHPREIVASMAAAKLLNPNRIILVFQPHTYTRTKKFWKQFVNVLEADTVILLPIYAAREKPIKDITSLNLAGDLCSRGVNAIHLEGIKKCAAYLTGHLEEGDLLLIMGAGDLIELKKLLPIQPN